MLHRLFYLLLVFAYSFGVYAQSLTISSSGNSGSYSYSSGTLTISGTANIQATQIQTWLNTSSLTILGNTNAISVNINENIISSTAGNGLTIGNSNSTGTVTFNNTVNLMGALTVYAEKINLGSTVVQDLQSAQLIAGGITGSISLYAKNGFETLATSGSTRGKIMTTGGGNININADYDNNNSGLLDIDWLTIDGGTGNIVLEAASYSWNTSSSVTLPEFYGTGALTIRNVPGANYSFTTAWIAVFGNFSGLTLGSNSGVEEILVAPCTTCTSGAKNYTGATWQIAGPINIYGSKVTVDLSLKSTLASADILFKSINSILVNASRSVTSNNGDITFWATADGTANSTDGDFIGIQNAVVINSADGLTNQTSGGGTITLAGGTTTQTLASGTIVPTGYAYSNRTTNWGPLLPPGGVNFGYSTAANGQVNSLSIYSGGGNIVIKGKSHSSSAGIQWFSGSAGATQIINSGVGTILFDGLATSTDAHGIEFMSYASVVSPTIISSNTSSAAISIKGETSSTNNRAGYQGTVKLEANGTGGGIEVNGKVASSSNYGAIEAGTLNAYALSGPITFISQGGLGLIAGGTWGKGTLPSSSSNITLRSDKISLYAATIESTGTLTVEPLGTSFASALTFPITNLTVGNTVSGLTLGKSTNTANITFANATTIAGPITAYGGNMFLNDNLTTTGTGADVLIKGTSNINLAASKTITTAAGDVNLWADSDDNSTGYVQLLAGAAINSTGGDINMGGGANLTSDYAFGTTAETCPEVQPNTQYISGIHLRQSSSLNSGGGNISLRGQNANTANAAMSFGVSLRGITMNSGTGKISLNGVASGSGSVNGQGVSSWGTLTLRSANTTTDAISIIGDASAVNAGVSSLGVNMVTLFEATGTGGGITINGKAGTATEVIGVGMEGAVLAASGPITIIGESTNNVQPINFGSGMIIGKKASTNVLTSSSNVILEANSITTAGTTIDCSGALTVRSTSTSFPSSFTWPLTNVTHAAGLSGLTIGKSTNTSTITIGTATSINGPITLYGGTLALNNALTTTNTGTGDLSLNGTTLSGASTLTVADGRTLTMNLSSNTNFAGPIVGTSLSFLKNGAGTLSLTGATALSFVGFTISGGTYRLNGNQQLTLSNALTNNGTFTMKDGATFLQGTSVTSITGTGTYNVQKALSDNIPTWSTTSGRFWYMGVPMVSVARSSYGTSGATTNRVWSYAESTKSYTELTDGNALLSAGTGYVHRRTTNDTLTFSAAGANGLYGGDLSLTNLTRTTGTSAGYHLVSNPYMAYLDWNSVTKTNIEPTFYIRTNNTTNSNISALISYNSETNLSTNTSSVTATTQQLRYIAPLQSIWVRVGTAAATGSLAMTRGILSHQIGNVGLKSSTVFPTLARVNLVDGNNFDQLLVYLNSDMSNEVDQYDSEKMAASGTVQVYTMSSNKKLVMNGLKNNKKKVSVPLYLELPETKSYTLQLSEYQVEDGLILLEDKQEGTLQDFTLMENYSFYANSGLLQNRFVLHFILPDAELTTQGPSNSWVAEEGSYTEGGDVEISNDDRGNIHITLNQAADQKVEGIVVVTDMSGKAVYSGQLEGIITTIELDVPSGIYYLTVQSGTLIEKKKVFIQD